MNVLEAASPCTCTAPPVAYTTALVSVVWIALMEASSEPSSSLAPSSEKAAVLAELALFTRGFKEQMPLYCKVVKRQRLATGAIIRI